jgi:integrase
MSKYPRLKQVRGWYHLRAVVPKDLRAVFGKTEIWRSLKTTDISEAKEKVLIENINVTALFRDARRKIRETADAQPSEMDIRRMVVLWFHNADQRAAIPALEVHGLRALEDALDGLAADEAALYRQDDDVMVAAQVAADDILAGHGWPATQHRVGGIKTGTAVVDVDKKTDWYRSLCGHVLRAMIEVTRRSRGRLGGQPLGQAFDPAFVGAGAGGAKPEPVPQCGITLEALIEEYKAAPERQHLGGTTVGGYKMIFRVLRELLDPGKPVREIDRDDCRRVRDVVMGLPPNATRRFPGLTMAEAARLAKDEGLPTITPASANGYLNNLSALFRWAVDEEYMDKNPATRLGVSLLAAGKKDRKRPFDADQLRKIFDAPLYRGCVDDGAGYAAPGPKVIRRGRFWVPLLSLFTGMRLNECCQLAVDDVATKDGVDVILVRANGDGKRVKSEAGERLIPVHPELKRLGFLGHVEAMRAAGEARLFPDLPMGAKGYFSDPFQKWFSRFLRKAGAKAPKTSFHSFRHCFRDALRESDVKRDAVLALGGWAGNGGTEEIYGSGLKASTLAREIAKIRYDLDLGHLCAR